MWNQLLPPRLGHFNNLCAELFKNPMRQPTCKALKKIWWAFCMCMFSCILCTSLHEEPPSLSMCASSHKKMTTTLDLILLGMMTWWLVEFKPIHRLIRIRGLTFRYLNYSYSNDGGTSLYGVLCFICCFYTTISVVWSSLDHSNDNSKIITSFSSLTTS
jgi:hypothetical protein